MESSSSSARSIGRWLWVGFFAFLTLRELRGAESLSDYLQSSAYACFGLFVLAFDPLKKENPTWASLSWPRRIAAFLGVVAAALLVASIVVR